MVCIYTIHILYYIYLSHKYSQIFRCVTSHSARDRWKNRYIYMYDVVGCLELVSWYYISAIVALRQFANPWYYRDISYWKLTKYFLVKHTVIFMIKASWWHQTCQNEAYLCCLCVACTVEPGVELTVSHLIFFRPSTELSKSKCVNCNRLFAAVGSHFKYWSLINTNCQLEFSKIFFCNPITVICMIKTSWRRRIPCSAVRVHSSCQRSKSTYDPMTSAWLPPSSSVKTNDYDG